MKHNTLFAIALTLLLASVVMADLPQPKDPLVMPAIALRQTPAQWVRIYRESEKDPATLLRYLHEHIRFVSTRQSAPVVEPLSDPEGIFQLETRTYVFNRLGDVGTPDLIPAIEQFIQRRREMNDWATQSDVALAQLSIERIQARARGPEAYKNTMLDWVRNPTSYPGALTAGERWTSMAVKRFGYGIRALAKMGANDAVTVILEALEKAKQQMTKAQWFFSRFAILHWLAQFEDGRVVGLLEEDLFLFGSVAVPWAGYHLEPGEKDPEWAYWQICTKGMDVSRTVETILQAAGNGGPGRFKFQILSLLGDPAIPALLKSVAEPLPCKLPENAQAVAIRALGELRSRNAVEPLLGVIRVGSPRLRREAIDALGKIGDPVALPDLLELAQNSDFYLQMAAIDALGNMGDSRAEPVLLKLLSEHPNANIRYGAAEALIKVGTPAAIPVLEGRLQAEPSHSVQGRIGWALQILRQKAR
ncbi:MAG: HEAT repeat domain-containing protein [Armatimonadota bacterium]